MPQLGKIVRNVRRPHFYKSNFLARLNGAIQSGITTLSVTTLSITTLSITTLSITTFSIMTLSIKPYLGTLSISDTQHNHLLLCSALSHYVECCILFIFILNVVMLSVVMLSVVAPFIQGCLPNFWSGNFIENDKIPTITLTCGVMCRHTLFLIVIFLGQIKSS
jgi:hypothetical protein